MMQLPRSLLDASTPSSPGGGARGWPYSCIYFHRASRVDWAHVGIGAAAAALVPMSAVEATSTTTTHAASGQVHVAEASLKRVLLAFCAYCPKIGYFQVDCHRLLHWLSPVTVQATPFETQELTV